MIHNKYFEILELLLGDYNRQIYGRELIGKVNLSQKGIALALEELENINILKSTKKGNLKFFRLNLKNPKLKDIIGITEILRKNQFMDKHRKIGNMFKSDDRVVGIFGSYAKNTQTDVSDIDVFIIGKKRENDYDEKAKTFDLKFSLHYFNEKEFRLLLKKRHNLIKEIKEYHILIFNSERFINLLWEDYYGFD